MFDWKVEEMSLLNEKGRIFFGNERIYGCETSVSREDKIAFIDSIYDGKLSYLLELIDEFNSAKDKLPHDDWGDVKTVSLKAWLMRNDSRSIIDYRCNYGNYQLAGVNRYIQTGKRGSYDTYEDLVDECFHRQLIKCERMEKDYFEEHDEYSILRNKLSQMSQKYSTTFGVNFGIWSNGRIVVLDENRNERNMTLYEARTLVSNYEKLEAYISELSEETHIKY